MTTSTVLPVGAPTESLTALLAAIDDYLGSTRLSVLSDADVVAELRIREVARRRLEAGDHAMVAQLDQRGLGAEYGARSTAGLYVDVLRISPADARARVAAGRELGPRPALSGGVLPPRLPMTAAAHAAGEISGEHVRAIVTTMHDLPSGLTEADRAEAERILTTVALQCPPRDVVNAGIRLVDTVDPDGSEPEDIERDQERMRRLGLRRRRDGMYELTGRLTPECGIDAEAVLRAYAEPRPAVDDSTGHPIPDGRTATQRMHDALQDLMGLALRADTLDNTGRRAELILTGTLIPDSESDTRPDGESAPAAAAPSEAATGVGPFDTAPTATAAARRGWLGRIAWTSFGNALSMHTALRLCDTALVATVTMAPNSEVLNYGRTRRFASKAQLRALIARDGGCSFPGCDHPPQWCDVHHIVSWIDGGPTDLWNLTLLCGYHHRNFQRMNWQCHIRQGIPEWTPPTHIDPDQQPRRNHRYLLR